MNTSWSAALGNCSIATALIGDGSRITASPRHFGEFPHDNRLKWTSPEFNAKECGAVDLTDLSDVVGR